MRDARGIWDRVGCGLGLVRGISGDFLKQNGNCLYIGFVPGSAWQQLASSGVVLFMVIGEKFASQILPRTPKWKRAEGQCEWRMFLYNTFL